MTQNNFESHAENFVRNSNAAQHQETAVCLSSTAIFSHKTQQKMTLDFSESIPVCVAFAIGGGLLEVFATAVLAYPAARILEGHHWSDWALKGCLALNIVLQIVASLSGNLFATWFGPVSVVAPVFFAAQLLANLVVYWIALGLEAFSHEMQIGTYVIVISVILLIVNGPGAQDYSGYDFEDFITRSYALAWSAILLLGMMSTGIWLVVRDLGRQSREWLGFAVLLIARSTAFSLNLTTGKALVLPQARPWFVTNMVIKILSGAIYTKAIVVQSTAVEQKTFVPLNAVSIVLVNALTGIVIWEDWRVVSSWLGYVCVFLLMALGCSLLLGDLGLLQESKPDTFRGARPTMFRKSERERLLQNIKNLPHLTDMDSRKFNSCTELGLGTDNDHDDVLHDASTTRSWPVIRQTVTIDSFKESLSSDDNCEIETERNGSSTNNSGRISRPVRRRISSRGSLISRNIKSQLAWAAIYEYGHAAHQSERRHHGSCHNERPCNSDPRRPRTTMNICRVESDGSGYQTQSRRSLFSSRSLLGFDSFRRRLAEMVDVDEEEEENNDIVSSASGKNGKHIPQGPMTRVSDNSVDINAGPPGAEDVCAETVERFTTCVRLSEVVEEESGALEFCARRYE